MARVSRREAASASPTVRSPTSRSHDARPRKTRAVSTASANARCRVSGGIPSQAARLSSEKPASVGAREFGEQPRVEDPPGGQGEAGERAFPLHHGEIKSDRVTDDRTLADEADEIRKHRFEGRRVGKIGIGNAVDRGRRGRDRLRRRDKPAEGLVVLHRAIPDDDRPDLYDSGGARLHSRGFGVKDNGLDRKEGRVAEDLTHPKPLLPRRPEGAVAPHGSGSSVVVHQHAIFGPVDVVVLPACA